MINNNNERRPEYRLQTDQRTIISLTDNQHIARYNITKKRANRQIIPADREQPVDQQITNRLAGDQQIKRRPAQPEYSRLGISA